MRDAAPLLVLGLLFAMMVGAALTRPDSRVRVTWPGSRATAVYRYWDTWGRLLYVGVAYDPAQRFLGHSRAGAAWVPYAARRSVEWHDSRPAALRAERAAIWNERPVFNIAGARPGSARRRAEYLAEVGGRYAA